MAAGRRLPLWLMLLATALLAAALVLGLDRGVTALRDHALPTATPGALQPVIVTIQTAEPALELSAIPADETQQALQQLEQQSALHFGYTFIQKAVQQITIALEALAVNDSGRADRELVAARASLDEAFRLVPEDLKPQIDTERLELGRIRANLAINPNGLDEDLRRMRDRLLSLIAPRPQ